MAVSPLLGGSTSGTLSSPGVGSGLDVNTIVSKLMAVESQPLNTLAAREAAYQAKVSGYGSLKGALSSFQSALQALTHPESFHTLSVSAGDATLLSATAAATATPGTYAVEITQLAAAQKLASAGFAATTTAVGSGTLSFDFGSFNGTTFTSNGTTGSKTVTIPAGQNSLAGIRDAVNAAAIGVTATIVNDGSSAGNRLVFTSNTSGAANSIKLTVSDSDGTNTDSTGLSQLAFDPAAAVGSGKNLVQNVAAQDALLKIDGIAVSKPTNVITDAIQGVSLSLNKTNVGSPTTLTVSQSTATVATAVQAFVKAYNDLNTTLVNLTKYDASSKQGSVLTGDSAVRIIQAQLRSVLGGAPPTGVTNAKTLAQIGVSFAKDGTLNFDGAAFTAGLAGDPSAAAGTFASLAKASDSLISATQTGSKTQSGAYPVTVTQLATQGSAAGSSAAGLTVTAGVNDQLQVTLDGVVATVTLAAGTYASAAALATDIQTKLNGNAAISGNASSATVSQAAGVLTLASNRYGTASTVALSGTAVTTVFGGSSLATAGKDVAGTIGGATGLGSGQVLSGPTGSIVEGLKLTVSGGATGARGNVSYSQGYAFRLDQSITQLLDTRGIIAASTDGANRSIKDIDSKRDTLTARLQVVEAQYRKQFNALDTLLASMSATSTYLTQQLANLPKISSGSN